jgi:hypothetical protein
MNRLLGTLFALATLVAIAFAILNYGNYTSMCFIPTTEEPATPADAPAEGDVIPADAGVEIYVDDTLDPLVDTTTVDAIDAPVRSAAEHISM